MDFKLKINAEEDVQNYYKKLIDATAERFDLAETARRKGFDASTEVETTPATDLADRAEIIIGPKGIAERYRTVIKETNNNRDMAIFKIFREIIEQKWCKIPDVSKRIAQAIRTALVLNTEGVVVAPLDGVPKIQVSENLDGSKFIDIYYAGPIRAAGGTSTVLPLILGDYARELLGLDRYKPTEDEVERYVEECQIYEEIFSRQYKITDDEVRKIIRGCSVCINGEPTEEREVAIHRDLDRVPKNRVRGGACLVICEGVALKAGSVLRHSKTLGLDWSWLEGIIKLGKSDVQEQKVTPNPKYLDGMAAGRPIFAYPSRIGGFRLRYGRSRNMGIMGKAIHPATMYLLDEFVAVGTQLKVERPGKAAGMCPCDSIEGPIVRLRNQDVVQVETLDKAIELKSKVEKILFLGDFLISVGDFRKSSQALVPAGYCEEWWKFDLENALQGKKVSTEIKEVLENPRVIDPYFAVKLSETYGIPLHPKAMLYYNALDEDELILLMGALENCVKKEKDGKIQEIEVENNAEIKEVLEKIGLVHCVDGEKIKIGYGFAYPLLRTLGVVGGKFKKIEAGEGDIVHALEKISGLKLNDKGKTFIGARMGRPEASRARKMKGNPHVLFPIGLHGGNIRSINKAAESGSDGEVGKISVEIASHKCMKCGKITQYPFCRDCNERTVKVYMCPKCGNENMNEKCGKCGSEAFPFSQRKIDLVELLEQTSKNLKMLTPDLVKGVMGMINSDKVCEPLEKGFLRAKHGLHIFRDATMRYELINAPLTHFKPKEIGTSVEKLREMGYLRDCKGKELKDESQLVEIFPQDIIIHRNAGDFFVNTTKFIDELLEKFYGIDAFFKINDREKFVGELVLGLAPHTSAAVVGRIIGYTKARVCFAHPYFHQTKRRNIDGDQDSLMLLMDGLLNFSQAYLPSSRGGRMDAPLVFTIVLNPSEIDEEVHEMETCSTYSREFYERASAFGSADDAGIECVKDRLGKKEQYSGFGFTHDTSVFDAGPKTSKYVVLKTMREKIMAQAELQKSIAAVDSKDALERVLASHFLPDIIGNARSFSKQTFRCTNCNTKYRRLPLSGKCNKCKKGNIVLTIAEGSVRKYLEIVKEIIEKYGLSHYLKQRVELISEEIDSVFVTDKKEQKSLFEFA